MTMDERTNFHASVATLTEKDPVVIFGDEGSVGTVRATNLLRRYSIGYKFVNLEKATNQKQLKRVLSDVTRHPEPPHIFVSGESIGDNRDLTALHERGELGKLLQEAQRKSENKLRKSLGSVDRRQREGDARSFISQTIDGSPVVVFSKSYCPFCDQVKDILGSMDVTFQVVELDALPAEDCEAIQFQLERMTGRKKVPSIFIKGKYIGGSKECEEAKESGLLKELLSNAGAFKYAAGKRSSLLKRVSQLWRREGCAA